MPEAFRKDRLTPWAVTNFGSHKLDWFLEGPSFDREGNLYVVDIPFGRIFKVSPSGAWELRAEYDGWPNGLKIHRDGSLYVADYKHGIVRFAPGTSEPEFYLRTRNSESFRGCNDLHFTNNGSLYFTDQGQTGMHDPTGRVYCLATDGTIKLLVSNIPSPNGIVSNLAQSQIYVAATRGNCVWRLPLTDDGQTTKVGVFIQLSGGLAGPDGLALDAEGGLIVCQVGIGILRFDGMGMLTHVVRCPPGAFWTNAAFGGGDRSSLYIVDSPNGAVLTARMPYPGAPMFAHS